MSASDFALYRLAESDASPTDIDAAVDVLFAAYAEDRAIEALSAGDKRAARLLFRRTVEAALHTGVCYLAYSQDTLCAVAAWLAPGSEWRLQEDAAFVDTLPPEVRDWYNQHYIPKYEELYRSGGVDSTAARRDAWKLERLGVLPAYRQKGVGRALLQAVCGKADRDRDVIVADVTNPAQVNYLQYFGFQYRSVKNMSCGNFPGFPIWCLVREPGNAVAASAESHRRSLSQPRTNPAYAETQTQTQASPHPHPQRTS